MKKKLELNWVDIGLIVSMSISTICWIFLHIGNPEPLTWIQLIVTPTCLVSYIILTVINKQANDKRYFIIYDNYFTICGKSIFDAKFIKERQNRKYVKHGVTCTTEKIYRFEHDDLVFEFGLMKLDNNRILMIVYNSKQGPDLYWRIARESIDDAIEHYYLLHEIEPLDLGNVFYKNKRNAFVITENTDGTFAVTKHRHYVTVGFHIIRHLPICNPGWSEIGKHCFETRELAEEFVKRQLK